MTKSKDSTALIIESMLRENTGTHFLDSGSAYGRSFERNQKRNFNKEDACQVDLDTCVDNDGKDRTEINVSFNLYHFLNAYLEHNEQCAKLEDDFFAFAGLTENEDKGWLELMEEFPSRYTGFGTTNTYNFDNILSQVIQFTTFSLTDDEYDVYILLQVHGGCDVRGGYTEPRIFKVVDRDYFFMAMCDISAYCDRGQGHYWNSDDCGYHWYFEGSTKKDKKFDWENVKVVKGKAKCPCGGIIHFGVSDSY